MTKHAVSGNKMKFSLTLSFCIFEVGKYNSTCDADDDCLKNAQCKTKQDGTKRCDCTTRKKSVYTPSSDYYRQCSKFG